MFELQPLVLLLELAKLLEFGGNCRIYVHTLGHDRALARKLAPTRQHERVDVKRLGDIANRDPGKVAQANGGCFELGAVSVCGSGAWLWHLDTPEVRSGCLLNRRRFSRHPDLTSGVSKCQSQAPEPHTDTAPSSKQPPFA